MKRSKAIKLAGSASALARLLKISRQAVSKWGLTVPELQVYRLKELVPEWFRPAKARRK